MKNINNEYLNENQFECTIEEDVLLFGSRQQTTNEIWY